MKIDEAINKCREWAYGEWDVEGYHLEGFCRDEYEELANWLEELKDMKEGYTKAIDDFAETLKSDEFQKYNIDMVFETSRDLTYTQCTNAFCEYVDSIAEQLKAGVVDG